MCIGMKLKYIVEREIYPWFLSQANELSLERFDLEVVLFDLSFNDATELEQLCLHRFPKFCSVLLGTKV